MAGGSGARDTGDVAAELVSLLWGADRVDEFLGELARRTAGAVEGAVSCGITVQGSSWSRWLAAASDEFARRMDAVQYEVDDGPCLTCLRDGTVVEVPDIVADRRWPAFRRRGRQEGAGASMSIPLPSPSPAAAAVHRGARAEDTAAAGAAIGAVNLYTRRAGGLTPADRGRGVAFAGQVAGAIALAARLAREEAHNQHLQAALNSRSTIDQAIGVIIGRSGLEADAAFDVLRLRSQNTNTKLRDVATQVIAEATARR